MAAPAITTSDPASRIFWQHCAPDIVTGDVACCPCFARSGYGRNGFSDHDPPPAKQCKL